KARRALARKERLDRALALTPVFAAALLAALFVVPPFAGSEPLPSLWTIVTRSANANAHPAASVNADDDSPASAEATAKSRRSFSGGGQAPDSANATARQANDPTAHAAQSSSEGH